MLKSLRTFPFFKYLFLFIYLAVLGLRCSTWDILVVAYGIQCSDQRSNLNLLHWGQSFSHWTIREVPPLSFGIYVVLEHKKARKATKSTQDSIICILQRELSIFRQRRYNCSNERQQKFYIWGVNTLWGSEVMCETVLM